MKYVTGCNHFLIFSISFLLCTNISSTQAKMAIIDDIDNTAKELPELPQGKRWVALEYVEKPNKGKIRRRRLQDRTCFPECTGMQVEDCIQVIEDAAADTFTAIQYPRSFEWGRVVLHVDNDSKVKSPPGRG